MMQDALPAVITVSPYCRAGKQRMAAAAVAYVAPGADGAMIYLIGGETFRVCEGVDEIEQLLGWRDAPAPKTRSKPPKAV